MKIQAINQSTAAHHDAAVEDAVEYINNHYMDYSLSAKSVSEQCGYTYSYIIAIFKAHTGTSMADYIQQVRMEHAVRVIEEHPEYPIQRICEECGYKNDRTLSYRFYKVHGISINKYMKGERMGESAAERRAKRRKRRKQA